MENFQNLKRGSVFNINGVNYTVLQFHQNGLNVFVKQTDVEGRQTPILKKITDLVNFVRFDEIDAPVTDSILIVPPNGAINKIKNESIEINKKFRMLEAFTDMVISGKRLSLLVTGDGGLGKTHTVLSRLLAEENEKFLQPVTEEDSEGNKFRVNKVEIIKGYTTARGLYVALYNNSDKLILFDDCDDVWKTETSCNLMKAALDNSGVEREISWNAESMSDIPRSFKFTGRVIFISNLHQNKMDEAVLTRCSRFEIVMTPQQRIDRMRFIVDKMKKDVSMEIKNECIDFLENAIKSGTQNISLRSLIEVIDYRSANEECERHGLSWRELAEYSISSSN